MNTASKMFLSCKNHIGVKANVLLKRNSLVSTPLVIGLLKPTIIIPVSCVQTDELRLIFLHELSHIRSKDLWVRLFSLISMILHWYNPFVFLLNKQIKEFSELCCDGAVVKVIPTSERRQYGSLILNHISYAATMQSELCAPFGTTQNIKRRLAHILDFKGERPLKKFLSGILAVMILISGTVTTYANGIYTNIISRKETWITPFESVVVEEFDLGNGFTAKSTTTSVTKVSSVKHSDERRFSTEQWNEILRGIESGSIVWED